VSNEATDHAESFLKIGFDHSFTDLFLGGHLMIDCNPSNMKCLGCSKKEGCDVIQDIMPLLSRYQNDRSLTIRFEVSRCTAIDSGQSSTLDDFVKL